MRSAGTCDLAESFAGVSGGVDDVHLSFVAVDERDDECVQLGSCCVGAGLFSAHLRGESGGVGECRRVGHGVSIASLPIVLTMPNALAYDKGMTTTAAQTTTGYLQSIAENFPARDSRGYVVGFYVYAGYGVAQKRESGPFPTEAEAVEWAGAVLDGHVVCGHVFTASGKIVHAPVVAR